jgi:hypothetical protein
MSEFSIDVIPEKFSYYKPFILDATMKGIEDSMPFLLQDYMQEKIADKIVQRLTQTDSSPLIITRHANFSSTRRLHFSIHECFCHLTFEPDTETMFAPALRNNEFVAEIKYRPLAPGGLCAMPTMHVYFIMQEH